MYLQVSSMRSTLEPPTLPASSCMCARTKSPRTRRKQQRAANAHDPRSSRPVAQTMSRPLTSERNILGRFIFATNTGITRKHAVMQFVILTTGGGGERQILFLVSEGVDHPHNLAFHFLTSISDGVRDLGEFLSYYECHYLLDVTTVYFNKPREKRRESARLHLIYTENVFVLHKQTCLNCVSFGATNMYSSSLSCIVSTFSQLSTRTVFEKSLLLLLKFFASSSKYYAL